MNGTDNPVGITARRVRQSLAIYPDPDAPYFRTQGLFVTVLQFLLRSACLSLEVFFHYSFGKRYLTLPKLLAAVILPTVCLFLAHFDFNIKVGFSLTQPGFLSIIRPNAGPLADVISNEIHAAQANVIGKVKKRIEAVRSQVTAVRKEAETQISLAERRLASSPAGDRLLHSNAATALRESYARRISELEKTADEAETSLVLESSEARELSGTPPAPTIYRRSIDFLKRLLNPQTRVALIIGLSLFFVVFSLFANFQVAWLYASRIFQGQFGIREAHPHSSGEPLPIFNPLYLLAHRFNAKTDLIKQFVEPVLCYTLGMILRRWQLLPQHFEFVSAWLMLGSILIFIRVYMENRNRERLHLDRLANELNADAFQLQQAMRRSGGTAPEVLQARGK